VQLDLRRVLARIAAEGQQRRIDPRVVRETQELAREAHRTSLMAAHYEDLRALLSSWRYLHRWVAVLMVLLVLVHVVYALSYGAHWGGG
jgi:hypothetical protein